MVGASLFWTQQSAPTKFSDAGRVELGMTLPPMDSNTQWCRNLPRLYVDREVSLIADGDQELGLCSNQYRLPTSMARNLNSPIFFLQLNLLVVRC